ncbi:MAG: ribokinase [Pseudomonadota bacterium]
MTIFNLGSINLDLIYAVPHLPQPGETLSAQNLTEGLGGKGANQSVAIARAGGDVVHVGAVGQGGAKLVVELTESGVRTELISQLDTSTGHAVIYVDANAENVIVLHDGANRALTIDMLEAALNGASGDDWLLAQNETNLVPEAVALAKSKGMKVAIAAAPFDPVALEPLLDQIDLLAVNEIEARQLANDLPHRAAALKRIDQLVTLGSAGAELRQSAQTRHVQAFEVEAVDTTGAGDTFLGFYLASFVGGSSIEEALKMANAAAALQVTRPGAATAIPTLAEVKTFLAEREQAS